MKATEEYKKRFAAPKKETGKSMRKLFHPASVSQNTISYSIQKMDSEMTLAYYEAIFTTAQQF